MKKKTIRQLVAEEVEGVLQILSQPHTSEKGVPAPVVPWEKVIPSGTEDVAVGKEVTLDDPEKVSKLITILQKMKNSPEQTGMFENCEVKLGKVLRGDKKKFKTYLSECGKVKKVNFG